MTTEHASRIVWEPEPEHLERSRLRRFMATQGIESLPALHARAIEDPQWYWAAMVDHLSVTWQRPYDAVLDLSDGIPWARWFVGAGYNYVHDAVSKRAIGPERDRPALVWEGDGGETRTLTYGELAAETNRFANALRRLGIGHGDRVGIFLPMLPETAIATLACSQIGAVFVPIFSGYGPEAVATRLRDCDARLLITADGFPRRGRVVAMKATADAALAVVPSVERVVVVRRIGSEVAWKSGRDHWWDELVASQPIESPAEPTGADDPFMIIYTSGTTGRPKGVVYHHRGAYLMTMGTVVTWRMVLYPRFLTIVPLFHCNGWNHTWMMPLVGGTVVCCRDIRAKAIYDAIADEGNAIYSALADAIDVGLTAESDEVQALIQRWHQHIRYFYEPSLDILRGLGEGYTTHPGFVANFAKVHPQLASFMQTAINHYVDALEHAEIVRLLAEDEQRAGGL